MKALSDHILNLPESIGLAFLCTYKGPKWQLIKPDKIISLQVLNCQCSENLSSKSAGLQDIGVLKSLCTELSEMATGNTETSSQSFMFSARGTAEVASHSPFRCEGNQEDVFHSLSGRYMGKPGSLLKGKIVWRKYSKSQIFPLCNCAVYLYEDPKDCASDWMCILWILWDWLHTV